MKKNFKILMLLFLIIPFLLGNYTNAQNSTQNISIPSSTLPVIPNRFVVPINSTLDEVAQNLLDQNLIENKDNFIKEFNKSKGNILEGAYKITPGMSLSSVVKILHGKPYMKWVVITPGLRKEEIAEILAKNLGWKKTDKAKWINYTKLKYDYVEGVYFPDTYLIPVDEKPVDVAKRLINKFNENFTPYLLRFNSINMQWTKGLTLASIVQREAANDNDMPLIAGILLNRLNSKMPLSVDATLQYVRGNKGLGWWAPINVGDKKVDSPYNTYKKAGLPPHPISNPGSAAIEAVLNPTKTDCLYYIHDKNRVTHCAATYAEHLANINTYLKK